MIPNLITFSAYCNNDWQLNHFFQLADFPEPLSSCSVFDVSDTSMEVNCDAGYDGGLNQKFYLIVYMDERKSSNVVYNISRDDKPNFSVKNLKPSTYYYLDVYSSNIKGKSKERSLLTSTTLASKQQSLGMYKRCLL